MTFRVPHSAFRILAAFWRLNLAEELQYRANFVASVLGTLFSMATHCSRSLSSFTTPPA